MTHSDVVGAEPAGPASDEIRLGISACILGQEVRYNGGHKLDRFLRDTLGAFVRFVPVCPEVEIGLGVPRETLRLERSAAAEVPRLVAKRSGSDHTAAMVAFARAKARELGAAELCGFILQKGSPSCGMERVRVYGAGGVPQRQGRGLFAQVLMETLPELPVEEDGRLNDPRLRENFIERIFAYRRLRRLFQPRWTRGELVAFHSREKLLLLAHDRPSYEQLGRLVAAAKATERKALAEQYRSLFLGGLARIATTRKQTNVLQHVAGHLREVLDEAGRSELHELIEHYHRGWVPLVVPLTLIRHHVRRHALAYLAQQSYLDPHPRELMLRNHV
ncbi:MAG: DUF1722 domain-containing protein [Proteobacteria bacterium]|nr:DUF1722 domain-containing protein [Pseudomonadota bacterium]